jgi:hypothetical protein
MQRMIKRTPQTDFVSFLNILVNVQCKHMLTSVSPIFFSFLV